MTNTKDAIRCLPAILAFVLPLSAATILDVGGSPNAGVTVGPRQAAAVGFTVEQTISNFAISAPILCVGCSGGIWLQANSIGPTASIGNSLGAAAYGPGTAAPFFTLPSLAPGLYFFIVSVDSGAAIWQGSSPIASTGNGATRELDFAANPTAPFVPLSVFNVAFSEGLNYRITGDVTTNSPEPGTAGLVVFSLGICVLLIRWGRSRHDHSR